MARTLDLTAVVTDPAKITATAIWIQAIVHDEYRSKLPYAAIVEGYDAEKPLGTSHVAARALRAGKTCGEALDAARVEADAQLCEWLETWADAIAELEASKG